MENCIQGICTYIYENILDPRVYMFQVDQHNKNVHQLLARKLFKLYIYVSSKYFQQSSTNPYSKT